MLASSQVELQELKNKFALLWSQHAISGGDFDTLGKAQSTFADATIQAALTLAWAETKKRFSLKAETPHGLFILGLGKLGGNDLNFSSDIDLIGYYDPDILPVSVNKGQAFITSHCLKALTQILMPRNSPDHIWRVDWRLRPESSGTGLCLSTPKAEKFYFFRALPWHRLALIKARVVAGDIAAGDAFLKTLYPFIWPQSLDFRAIDDLADLKSRINAEHPGLTQERAAPTPITPDPVGFNLKLGSGGIREIEFIANAQQLIWGGKQVALQTTNTRQALSLISELNHLDTDKSKQFRRHYITLRRVENAVQMLRNEQTHLVPDSDDDKTALLALTGYADWERFSQDIFDIRQAVNAEFKSLFEIDTPSQKIDTVEIREALSPRAQEIARTWRLGFSEHGLSQSLSRQYRALGNRLLQRVQNSVADTEEGLIRIDRFLKSISRSAQYFHLLERHESLLDTLITPLLHSPHMTSLLEQSPHIIDIFLIPRQNKTPDASVVLADPDYGTRLDRLRRFVNEHLFYYYHRFMEKGDSLAALQSNLTCLAEITLETSIEIVKDELGIDDLKMSVLGLGKMGTRTMAPKSDLDIVFIFDDVVDSELASQVVRRLKTTLMTPLREGIAYELDMRLRPSGRSGPPAVKFSSFQNHHMTRAASWEHIALAHSQFVAGDEDFGRTIEAFCKSVLTRPRDAQHFKQDARDMWERIDSERLMDTPHDHFNAKLRHGGLMQAQYIEACFKTLGDPCPDTLSEAIAFWQHQQIWERLLGLKTKPFTDIPERFQSAVSQEAKSLKHYAKQSKLQSDSVINATQELFGGIPTSDNNTPTPVLWIN